jgi:hypothetical protein
MVPDELLPPAEREPEEVRFIAEPRHHRAIDVFMETHSVKQVATVLGRGGKPATIANAYSFTRHPWFLEQLKKKGFVAIDPQELGQSIAVGAGVQALAHLESPELSVDAVKKLGELGIKLMDAGKGSAGGNVHVGNILALDLRGLSVEEMRQMLGGSAADAASDGIDTDWSGS